MTYKIVAVSILLLFIWPALAQTPTDLPAESSANASVPVKIDGSVRPPVLISTGKPPIKPSRLRAASGVVFVDAIIRTDGVPTDLHILQSAGDYLDKNAMAAVSQYRFRPATKNGKPVAVRLNIRVSFSGF